MNKLQKNPFIIFFTLAILPGLFLGFLILKCSVNVPFADQWLVSVVIDKFSQGNLAFNDLIAQHNESRKFFPRLILLGLAYLTHWDVRYEMLVIFLLACIVSINIYRLSRLTVGGNAIQSLGIAFLSNLLIFSPIQYENWLWGIQVVVFIPIACITTCIAIAYSKLSELAKFILCAGLCTFSTFSYANGLLSWIVVFPVLALAKSGNEFIKKKRLFLGWIAAFSANLFVYFYNYQKPGNHPGFLEAIAHPLQTLQYFLLFLGSPLAFGTAYSSLTVATIIGAVLIILIIAVGVYLFGLTSPPYPPPRNGEGGNSPPSENKFIPLPSPLRGGLGRGGKGVGGLGFFSDSPPSLVGKGVGGLGFFSGKANLIYLTMGWLAIASYTLISALITSVGRVSFGVEQALSSRYTSFSVYLIVAIVHLIAIVLKDFNLKYKGDRSQLFTIQFSTALVTTLVLLHLLTASYGVQQMYLMRQTRLQAKACLLFFNLVQEDCLFQKVFAIPDIHAFPIAKQERIKKKLAAVVNPMDKLGFLQPGFVKSPNIRDIEGKSSKSDNYGWLDRIAQLDDNTYRAFGWAILPERKEPADVVILTYDTPKDESIVFSLTEIRTQRVDVVNYLDKKVDSEIGWQKEFSVSKLPKSALKISAWAFDTHTGKAYKLNGTQIIQNGQTAPKSLQRTKE